MIQFKKLKGYKVKEVWKSIKGFENYQVSNIGRVKSVSRAFKNQFGNSFKKSEDKILSPFKTRNGYMYVDLCHDSKYKRFSVHFLVASHFVQNEFNKPQINHIDGNKENNSDLNLEWCSAKENVKHSYDIGLRNITERQLLARSNSGKNNKGKRKPKLDVYSLELRLEIIKLKENKMSNSEIIDKFKVSKATITRIMKDKNYYIGLKCNI